MNYRLIAVFLLFGFSVNAQWLYVAEEFEGVNGLQFEDTTATMKILDPTVWLDTLSGGLVLYDTINGRFDPVNYGDTYALRCDFVIKQRSTNGYINVGVNIGGDQNKITGERREVGPGWDTISVDFPVFTLGTFIANNGEVKVKFSGYYDVKKFGMFIERKIDASTVDENNEAVIESPASAQDLNQATETIVDLGFVQNNTLGIAVSADSIDFSSAPLGTYMIRIVSEIVESPVLGGLDLGHTIKLKHKSGGNVKEITRQTVNILSGATDFLGVTAIVVIKSVSDVVYFTTQSSSLLTRSLNFSNTSSPLIIITKLK